MENAETCKMFEREKQKEVLCSRYNKVVEKECLQEIQDAKMEDTKTNTAKTNEVLRLVAKERWSQKAFKYLTITNKKVSWLSEIQGR